MAGRVSRVARWRSLMISTVVGWRPWAATKAGISASLRSSMAAARWENSAKRVSGTPATSQRIWSEWRRDLSSQSHPNSWVNRSASMPWCSSPSMTTLLNRPRESSVRHCPSETDRARLATTTWSWSWGSPALESKWVNAAATTPSTSSWTTPFLPEREWKTSRSA